MTSSFSLAEALQHAFAAYSSGKFFEAESLCCAILAARPDAFDACKLLATVQHLVGRREQALENYERALTLQPGDTETFSNRGMNLHELSRFDEALESYQRALAVTPDYASALFNRGNALRSTGQFVQALASYDSAIAARPAFADAFNNRGNALRELRRFDEAVTSYEYALGLQPDHASALNNRGVALYELGRFDEASASYDQAIALRPNYPAAFNNRGNAEKSRHRLEAALKDYTRALALQPDYPEVYNNLGLALERLKKFDQALSKYRSALVLRPNYAEALRNSGKSLKELNRFDEALANYNWARIAEPDNRFALTGLADCAVKTCNWRLRDEQQKELHEHVVKSKSVVGPFLLLGYFEDASLQLTCARAYVSDQTDRSRPPRWQGPLWRNKKLKIAYISADFREHATAFLITELIELHDRSRFEIIGVSYGPDDSSKTRARLIAAFDKFIDARAKSDAEIVALLRAQRVDIAVDLMGHTGDSRLQIMALRAAPIQVNYLGFPGTIGADFVDYIVADEIVLPRDQQRFYSEKVVYLPDCFQVNDRRRRIAAHVPKREQIGLPSRGFVFCCLNNSWKITPTVFDVWMRLLRQVEGSVLWLLSDNEHVERNLRIEARARGVEAGRLVFTRRVRYEDYLARYRLADLFLDTLPYNSGATASDALWAGLPLLTCQGTTFSGRMASSLLHAIGLPDLVVRNLADYEAKALSLARDEILLAEIKGRLANNRDTCSLFDTDRFRKNIEAAYLLMWQIWQCGEPPRSIVVPGIEMDSRHFS